MCKQLKYKENPILFYMCNFRIYNFYKYQEIHVGVEIHVGAIKANSLKYSMAMKNQTEGLGEKWVQNRK